MKAKDNEEKYPDFSKEVASLDNMVTSFKSKVDEFDATAADQQAKLVSTLRADWSSIQTQYQKATELWSKGHPQNSSDN